jgi:hypothetical protein
MVIPEGSRWAQGHIDPWWQGHRDLDFSNEQFNDQTALNEWRALGYTQTRFTGDMYDMRHAEPGWIDPFRQIFAWRHFSWSVYRMPPGTVLPNHSDTYARFQRVYGIDDIEKILRAVIYLEDWQSGHYAEVNGVPIVNWHQGDYIVWRGSTPHLAANNGKTHRYTLQITGVA